MMKIELQYEEADGIVREVLYDAYDTLYKNILIDEERVKGVHNLALVEHVLEDLKSNKETFNAVRILLQYFDRREDALERMSQITKTIHDERENNRYQDILKGLRA